MIEKKQKPLKDKKCKECGKLFTPNRPLQQVCSPICAMSMANKKVKKEVVKAALVEKREWKEKKRDLKDKIKTHANWMKELEHLINHIVRIIDYGNPCISCGRNGKPQAGHYHSVGSNAQIRFHLDNIHIQDYYCNVHLSANKTGYNEGLINTFGKEYQEYIEFDLVKMYPTLKLTIPELKEKIKICRNIIKELPEGKVYKVNERIEIRKQLNERIGIYGRI